MSVSATALERHLNDLFRIDQYQDYCPNGLQIEGKENIKKVGFAVSATKSSIEAAVKANSDALIVHHGLFWNFHGAKTIVGPFAKRVAPLIRSDINLFGLHLPLDAHDTLGNAAQLCQRLGVSQTEEFGFYKGMPTGRKGIFSSPISPNQLKEKLQKVLSHNVLHAAPNDRLIQSIGIITGGANSQWKEAYYAGLDAYITGEMSEHDWHESQEAGIHMFAGGHHATEQFGIQALMEHLKEIFGLEVEYFDSLNPA